MPSDPISYSFPVEPETVAQAMLMLLHDRGVNFLFGNGGTDFASIVDGFARFDGMDAAIVPVPVTLPHEAIAGSMAHGFFLATGRPQAVMVHVTPGTANVLGSIINASRAQVPILFMAGRTPISEAGGSAARNLSIHWAQESFDQASMVREWTKWDYEVRSESDLEGVIDRAFAIAMTEPRGPVYISWPREVLARTISGFRVRRRGAPVHLTMRHPEPQGVREAAAAIVDAHHPVIVTASIGAYPEAVEHLIALADRLAIPVVESGQHYMNFPTSHPLHAGYRPEQVIAESDCVIVIEADVPWQPNNCAPHGDAIVIHIATDPLRLRYPIWGFRVDIAIASEPTAALISLRSCIEASVIPDETILSSRREALTRQQLGYSGRSPLAPVAAETGPMRFAWVSRCIDESVDSSTVLVNEYDLILNEIERTVPRSFFGLPPSGGLGWALGAALGLKLASPERTHIACVGDGAYMFGEPVAAHFVARSMNLPILVVVFNNGSWGAVRDAVRRVHPAGWAEGAEKPAFTSLEPSPAFEEIVRAFGGYGERVDSAVDLPAALSRALSAVREEGRQALLNVICRR